MPTRKPTNPLYHDKERRYNEAKEAFLDGEFEDVAKCARVFNLNRRNLANRINGGESKSTRRATNQRLNAAQELALFSYIRRLDDQCMSPDPTLIKAAANFIIQEDDGLAEPLGDNWWTRFHKRHRSKLFMRRRRPLAAARKDAFDVEDLQDFYRKLKKAIDSHGIQQADMWNMDETGFRIGVGKSKMVISFDKKKRNYMADPDNRDYCTAVETISAIGVVIPPLIILKATHILLKWSQNNLDERCQLGATESGYSNDDLALDWLQHFIDSTRKARVGRYILLIVDGFGSHMTLQFFRLATASNIILFKLPAHSTHITQPLDVGCFQPYKAAHGNAIERAVRNGDSRYNRLTFLSALQEIRDSVFIRGTIRNAWRRCGISPFNPDVVLGPMKAKINENAAARPATPPPDPSECLRRTPRGPDSYRRNIFALKEHFVEHRNFNVSPHQMNRFLKATESMINTLQLTTRDLEHAQKETAQREGRNSLPGWRAKTSGIIRVDQCREQFSERAKKEAAAAERKAKREAAKAEKLAQANAKAKENEADGGSEEEENAEEEDTQEDEEEEEEEEEEEDENDEDEGYTEHRSPCPSPPRPRYSPPPPAVVGSKRVRKPSRKAMEKDSDSSPSPSPPPPRRRRRQNVSPD